MSSLIKQIATSSIFTAFLAISVVASDGKKPRLEIVTSASSCTQNCDGSARVLYNNGDETLLYEWLDNNNQVMRRSIFPKLQDACEGDYKVRIIKKKKLDFSKVKEDRVLHLRPLKVLEFSSIKEQKISVGFEVKVKKEFKDLNKQISIYYSIDKGNTWNKGSKIHPLKSSVSGYVSPSLIYSSILPVKANGQKHVMVIISANYSGTVKELKKAIKKNSYEVYHIYRKHVPFKIQTRTKVEVNSFVSHELNGGDGLIALEVSGGYPPYSYKWNIGSDLSSIGKLRSGDYSVVIKDSKKCELKRYFNVRPVNEILPVDLEIQLIPTKKKGSFKLKVNEVYNKLIYMYVHSEEKEKIKQFLIHPLEQDVEIPIDLTLLDPGNYTAEYIIEDRSISQSFNIIK
ncbi:MAG: hypothetical protein HKN39_02615 [Flavobacteriales bacterium]|nr:hypothetical protein [Flavobacteriales bacterium]